MKFAYFWIYLFTCYLGVSSQTFGQNPEDLFEDYSFNVIYLDYNPDVIKKGQISQLKWHYFNENNPYKLNLLGGRISNDYFYSGLRQLTFFTEVPGANGEKIYQPSVQVDLGAPGRKLVVVFGNGKENYGAKAFEIGDRKLPQDYMKLINLSRQAVIAKVGEKQSIVDVMSSSNFSVSGTTKRFRLPTAFAVKRNGRLEIIKKRKMAFTQGGRKILILYPDRRRPEDINYLIHNVVDLPPREFYSEEFEDINAINEIISKEN
jgi:hypothetical protein